MKKPARSQKTNSAKQTLAERRYQQTEFPGRDRSRRKRKAKEKSVGVLMDRLMENIGAKAPIALVQEWAEVTGEELFAHLKFGSFDEQGTLHICASSPHWAEIAHWESSKIQQSASKILSALGPENISVKQVKIAVNPTLF